MALVNVYPRRPYMSRTGVLECGAMAGIGSEERRTLIELIATLANAKSDMVERILRPAGARPVGQRNQSGSTTLSHDRGPDSGRRPQREQSRSRGLLR